MPFTDEGRRKAGQTTWERHGRIPPGRKLLPRLSEKGSQPRRGGRNTTERKGAPIAELLIF